MELPIASLWPGDSPRLQGVDQEHVARLAEIETPLPPILVDRRTLKVIDGMHRLLAALAQGRRTIHAEFFDGTEEDAFLCAVMANVTHGLPLSQAERRAAAARIITSQPRMSDRAIARASGLGAKAVAAIRRNAVGAAPCMGTRIGMDGKVRPLDAAEGRRRAAEVLAERPEASLREVARITGISPATVSDVRKRLQEGRPPTPVRSATTAHSRHFRKAKDDRKGRPEQVNPVPVVEKLLRDPSLRHKEEGRHLLRLLQQNAIGPEVWYELTTAVPPHCGALIGKLARQFAQSWLGFAEELDEQFNGTDAG